MFFIRLQFIDTKQDVLTADNMNYTKHKLNYQTLNLFFGNIRISVLYFYDSNSNNFTNISIMYILCKTRT